MQQAQALPALDPRALPVLLTCPEVAAVLRVAPSTVYRAVQAGEIRGVRLGSKKASTVRIPVEELRRILEDRPGRDRDEPPPRARAAGPDPSSSPGPAAPSSTTRRRKHARQADH